jgi:thiosulfate/3-mercaptopyruvate sulfurtransferase
VRALIGAVEVELIDARSPADFAGQQGDSSRLGRLPGSINIPAALVTDSSGQRFLPADRLSAVFTRFGLSRERRIIVYDASGIAATKVALALALLGYTDVGVYDAGWAEWGARLDLPINR